MTRLANILRSAAVLAVVALWVLAYALATVVGTLVDRWHRKDIEAQPVIDGPRAIREATPVDVDWAQSCGLIAEAITTLLTRQEAALHGPGRHRAVTPAPAWATGEQAVVAA